jgi:bifunctional DNA-binding transcriptional regulator/antitoxin component of YhaV-PrlF toxin-antitoxin module
MAEQQEQQFLGIVANVGEDGTIKVPSQFLESAGIRAGGKIEVFANTDTVFFRTIETFCDLCGGNANVRLVGNLNLCSACINNLNAAADGGAK